MNYLGFLEEGFISNMIFKFIKNMGWQEHELTIKFYGKKNEVGEGFQVRNIRVFECAAKPVFYQSPNEKKQKWIEKMKSNKAGQSYHKRGGEVTARKKALLKILKNKSS